MVFNRMYFFTNFAFLCYSSVPIQDTTSITTLVLVCLSMVTAAEWGTHSKLCPSTARRRSPHFSFPSFAAGLSGTTKSIWTRSGLRSPPGSAPPIMENPQLVQSLWWRITVLEYWRTRGSFCQYIQLGIKFDAPKLVSGPWKYILSNILDLLFPAHLHDDQHHTAKVDCGLQGGHCLGVSHSHKCTTL